MLTELLARFFGRKPRPPEPEPERVAEQVDGDLRGCLPRGKIACVLRDGIMVNVCRDHPPASLAAGETCWLVPADDVTLPVAVTLGERTVAADVALRFEPESQLAELLRFRTVLLKDDLVALVTSELAGLLDLLGQQNADELLTLDDESRERLRAKLSLLLQTKGFRSTGIENIRLAPAAEPEIIAAEAVEEPAAPAAPETPPAAPSPAPAPPAVTPPPAAAPIQPAVAAPPPTAPALSAAVSPGEAEQVQRELTQAVGEVKSDADWDALMGELERVGFRPDVSAAEELAELGEKLVDRQVAAGEAAGRIRQMADAAAQRAGIAPPDLRRWQGLALRLRWLDTPEEAAQALAVAAPGTGAAVPFAKSRRPWTWWMLRRRSVDERLRQHLADAARQSRASLEQYMHGLREVRHAARVRELVERLVVVEDLLATVPTLSPPHRKLRPDRERVKELVGSVDRAVTAVEMVEGAGRAMTAAEPGSPAWDAAAEQVRAAADALADHLRARRAVR